jgi:uncharacterized membrane protein YjgN (DUF898 family)
MLYKIGVMVTFLIVLGVLLVTNYLLLEFSCNDASEADYPQKD